jgi:hypothetical protein
MESNKYKVNNLIHVEPCAEEDQLTILNFHTDTIVMSYQIIRLNSFPSLTAWSALNLFALKYIFYAVS